ncbi:hypothetical protein [Nostoc sp. KVJ3]|uniref:hypothetical protein n=1 Tax=Nostoc sp. KVJ3 TaxID=457945 RepID=UPI0022375FFF|nr:hypothetical protein [Nostoc sp. KVJ3]
MHSRTFLHDLYPAFKILTAIRHTELSLWIEALDRHLKEKLETVSAQPEIAQALLNRLNRAMFRFGSSGRVFGGIAIQKIFWLTRQ